MNQKFITPIFIVLLGIFIIGGYYFLQTASMQSFYPQQKEINKSLETKPTKIPSLLNGQYECSVKIPNGSSIAIQINQGKVYGSMIAKSGDHIEAVYDKEILYVWDQEKQQGTKFTNVANIISQMTVQNSNSCKNTTFTDSSQFTVPTSVTFKENNSNNPLDILQSLQ